MGHLQFGPDGEYDQHARLTRRQAESVVANLNRMSLVPTRVGFADQHDPLSAPILSMSRYVSRGQEREMASALHDRRMAHLRERLTLPNSRRTKANPWRPVPAPFDQLTARDWSRLRTIVRGMERDYSYGEYGDEHPYEDVMTSVGYVVVGTDGDDDTGYVSIRGETLPESEWPRATRRTKANGRRALKRRTRPNGPPNLPGWTRSRSSVLADERSGTAAPRYEKQGPEGMLMIVPVAGPGHVVRFYQAVAHGVPGFYAVGALIGRDGELGSAGGEFHHATPQAANAAVKKYLAGAERPTRRNPRRKTTTRRRRTASRRRR